MMVSARGVAKWWTNGEAVSNPTEGFVSIGTGMMPVVILLVVGVLFHLMLTYTLYGRHTYAIGSNAQAARMSGHQRRAPPRDGLRHRRHAVRRRGPRGRLPALTAQSGMGQMYELDAIAIAVIGGVSLIGGPRLHHRHGHRHADLRRHHLRLHLPSGRRLLPGMIKGAIIVAAVVADIYRQKQARNRGLR
jgi:inositol transport system permease protein